VSLFNQLVDQALQNQGKLSPLRIVVEKELLHHDILREMSTAGLLKKLTFIGGTCLRACYGSSRLSEDLDFAGGTDFYRADLANLGQVLMQRLKKNTAYRSQSVNQSGTQAMWIHGSSGSSPAPDSTACRPREFTLISVQSPATTAGPCCCEMYMV